MGTYWGTGKGRRRTPGTDTRPASFQLSFRAGFLSLREVRHLVPTGAHRLVRETLGLPSLCSRRLSTSCRASSKLRLQAPLAGARALASAGLSRYSSSAGSGTCNLSEVCQIPRPCRPSAAGPVDGRPARSPSPRGEPDSHAAAGAALPSPPSSGRPCGCLHPARPAESSSRSTAPLARTPAIANRASAPHAPGRPSAAGTPANTAVGSSASCPPPPSLRVSTKPGQLHFAQPQYLVGPQGPPGDT